MGHLIPSGVIEHRILVIRDQKVILDSDLARIYGVTTKRLNQQVRRNARRFPRDFMFRLDESEADSLRLQSATLKVGRGEHRKYRPYAFTEHGAVMLAAVLHTPVAVEASIQIARAFVKMREFLAAHKELARALEELEERVTSHDSRISRLFDAIHRLMNPTKRRSPKIGFRP